MTTRLPALLLTLLALVVAATATGGTLSQPTYAADATFTQYNPLQGGRHVALFGTINVDPGTATTIIPEFYGSHDQAREPQHPTVDVQSGDDGLTSNHTHLDVSQDLAYDDEWFFDAPLQLTATPGWHTLTVTVRADDYDTRTFTYRVWGRGGPAPTAGDSLAGRAYLGTRIYGYGSRDVDLTYTSLWFLDGSWVYVLSRDQYADAHGTRVPATCSAQITGCERYAYADGTGRVDIDGSLGRVTATSMTWDNLDLPTRVAAPGPGARLGITARNGSFRFTEPGDAGFRIVLRTDGTYVRHARINRYDGVLDTVQRGSYAIGDHGTLRLHPKGGGATVRTTIGVRVGADGHPLTGTRAGVALLGISYSASREFT